MYYTYYHLLTSTAEEVSCLYYSKQGIKLWLLRNWRPFCVSQKGGTNAELSMNICIYIPARLYLNCDIGTLARTE